MHLKVSLLQASKGWDKNCRNFGPSIFGYWQSGFQFFFSRVAKKTVNNEAGLSFLLPIQYLVDFLDWATVKKIYFDKKIRYCLNENPFFAALRCMREEIFSRESFVFFLRLICAMNGTPVTATFLSDKASIEGTIQ